MTETIKLASGGKFSEFPPRPILAKGEPRAGRAISVTANIFPITAIANVKAFQYDVTIDPEVPPTISRRLWGQVEAQVRQLNPALKGALLAYDGRKNSFSTADLGPMGQPFTFSVPFDKNSETGSASRTPEVFKITLKKVAGVHFGDLLRYSKGEGAETDVVLHAMNCLATVINHVPSMVYTPVGSNFFSSSDKSPISGGLEVWRGFHQSIRAMMAGHLGLNVDTAASVFRKGNMPLTDLACELMGARDISDLGRQSRLRDRFQRELKGILVTTTHRGDLKQRFRIGSISEQSVAEYSFDMDGVQTTMAQYFEKQYNYRVRYPWLPVVLKGNGRTGFPMEVLLVAPSQRFTKRLSGQQVSEMIKATIQKPQDRCNTIRNSQTLIFDYSNNPYMKSFGLKVSTEMMRVPARQLTAPELLFADRKSVSGRDGVWNLKGLRLVSAPPLGSVAFVFFVRVRKNDADEIRDTLLEKWARAGVDIRVRGRDVPVMIGNPSSHGEVGRTLQNAFGAATKTFGSRCQLLVCIIDKEPKELYQQIKRITLTEAGVLSQCLQFRNVNRANAIKDQYAANVAMKVNIKLGGATNTVDVLPGLNRPTMLAGADVTHPSPGSAAPSIAAVVTSTDKNATKYNTFLRAQGSRVELIADMESVIGEGLDRFKAGLNIYPERLIFFRDGVAAGQFREVRNKEVIAIKSALARRGILDKCQLLFIVVQKRHHIRLFPDRGGSDRSGNCVPGTVIDSHITHPFEHNFILQSHAGIQGTSRPAIYHVIYDEIKMHPDSLQQLCYNLCFLAERATRSISFVAPSYRAHLAAFYGRMFIEGEYSDTASVQSGGSEAPFRMRNVTQSMTRTMYYM